MTNDENANNKMEPIPEDSKTIEQSNEEKVQIKETKNKNKVSRKKQLIFVVITVLVIIGITATLIFLKVNSINNDNKEEKPNILQTLTTNNEKKEDPDLKYVLSNYTDTYNQNDLEIEYLYDNDGKIESKANYDSNKLIGYIEISGLKNEKIQDAINEEIKSIAYSLADGKNNFRIYTTVYGNFSNILSIKIQRIDYKKDKDGYDITDTVETVCLNYNLNTGEKIEFEKIFTASTPIASIIADAAYIDMAWDTNLSLDMSEEEYDKHSNMDRRDTSQYEENLLAIINEYNNKKGKIEYCVSPTHLYIYNLGDLGDIEIGMTVKLADYRDYVAIYKRYAEGDIFNDNNVGIKDVIAFTVPSNYTVEGNIGMYGKLTDNLFVDFGSYGSIELKEVSKNINNKILSHAKNKVQELLKEIKKEASSNSNKGYVLEGYVGGHYNAGEYYYKDYESFIEISIFYSKSEMSRKYFNNEMLEKMVYCQYKSKASVDAGWFSSLAYEIDEITSNDTGCRWFYDLNGNYLGDKETDLIKKQITVPNDNKNDEITIVAPYS